MCNRHIYFSETCTVSLKYRFRLQIRFEKHRFHCSEHEFALHWFAVQFIDSFADFVQFNCTCAPPAEMPSMQICIQTPDWNGDLIMLKENNWNPALTLNGRAMVANSRPRRTNCTLRRICKEKPIDNLTPCQLTTTIRFQVEIYFGFCHCRNTEYLWNNICLLELFIKERWLPMMEIYSTQCVPNQRLQV